MKRAILGISAYYHDSAAALLVDGEIVAAAQEERFTRKRHDPSFPIQRGPLRTGGGRSAVRGSACGGVLRQAVAEVRTAARDVSRVRASGPRQLRLRDSGLDQGEAVHEAAAAGAPGGARRTAEVPIFFPEHHLSHAASAFYPSPFEDAAIVTVDGVGEWATTTIGHGHGKDITILRELAFPHSVGLLYSAFTYYTGFKVNSGEYKLMGLAPYGNPDAQQTAEFVAEDQDGSGRYPGGRLDSPQHGLLRLCHRPEDGQRGPKWERLFGVPARKPESEISPGLHEHGAGHPAGDRGHRPEAVRARHAS